MARRLLYLLVLLACSGLTASAQVSQGPIYVTSDPGGTCANGSPLEYNFINGALWGCQNGSWAAISSSGASVASVSSSDNHYTVSPTTGAVQLTAFTPQSTDQSTWWDTTTVTYSTTPAFTCASGRSINLFTITMTGNVTAPTFSCAKGTLSLFQIINSGTFTFTWMSGFGLAPTVQPNTTTYFMGIWDGANMQPPLGTSQTPTQFTGPTVAALGTPATGSTTCWLDTTTKNFQCKDDAGVITQTVPVSTPGATVPSCAKYTLSNNGTNWTVNGAAGTAIPAATATTTGTSPVLFALPAKGQIHSIQAKTTTAWSGTGFTSMTLSIGDSAGSTTSYTSTTYNMFAATGNTNFQVAMPGFTASGHNVPLLLSSITYAGSNVLAAITGNQNLNANTITGVTDIDICWVTLP